MDDFRENLKSYRRNPSGCHLFISHPIQCGFNVPTVHEVTLALGSVPVEHKGRLLGSPYSVWSRDQHH